MSKKLKASLFVLCVALIMLVGVVGVYSYLTDMENALNTFTVGDVAIELEETTGETYEMIPGKTLGKDPTVTVKADSVDCLVFVEVIDNAVTLGEKTYHASDFLTYSIGDGWKLFKDNIYYRQVLHSTDEQELPVLKNNKVVVKDIVTEEMMNDLITAGKKPELTFKAYAIQAKKGGTKDEPEYFELEEAWAQLNPPAESGE